MSLVDAKTAQGMATRHHRSIKAVQWGLQEVNALLAKMIKGGKIKYGGYGTHATWDVKILKETSPWVSGQLGTRTFEERNPVGEATVPYCFTDATYGISEKSLKTNRAAGNEKIYDIQKENAEVAQASIYRAIVAALYSNVNSTTSLEPVGLFGVCGDPYETSDAVTVDAGKSYGGIMLTTSGVSAWNANYSTMGWDHEYWYPTCIDQQDITAGGTSAVWSDDCLAQLGWMCDQMSRTADVSGTGKILRPDMALMGTGPWGMMRGKLVNSQSGTAGVPIGTTDPKLNGFVTVRVGTLDCVYDQNVKADKNGVDRVLVLDSDAFYIETLNTKAEGLIEGAWDDTDPKVVGGVGMYKSNLTLICKTPLAVGCITGCNG
jgi:hypothetical protein